jgi:hypothetical protein
MDDATSTVAVSTPLNRRPVPGAERIEGFTMTMCAIVTKVVTPPTASAYRPREVRLDIVPAAR